MAEYEVKVGRELLSNLLTEKNGLAGLVEEVLNQVLDAQMTEHIGAAAYERSEGRQGYRNGYRLRTLYTRIGPLCLRVPQCRDGSFSPEIFARYQRSEQAFVLALMEMVINGVSTRKVAAITEELCGASFSKSTVSHLCAGLDRRVAAWNERPLTGEYPVLIADAVFVKAREGDAVVSKAALLVSGITAQGYREILGVKIGEVESYGFWDDTFAWLRKRGLKGVVFVVSDEHDGLLASIRKHFAGCIWQRCQVHLMRNVLSHTPASLKGAMAVGLKRVLAAETRAEAHARLDELAGSLGTRTAKAIACLECGLDDALNVLVLPEKYRRRLKSTNLQERLIGELRRRERVIRIFPNEAAAHRLLGALLAEQHEIWQTRIYLDMAAFHEWNAQRKEHPAQTPVSVAAEV